MPLAGAIAAGGCATRELPSQALQPRSTTGSFNARREVNLAGNTVVIKPSNVAKHSALLIARLCRIYLDPLIVTVVGPEIEGDRQLTTALLETKFDVRDPHHPR